MEENNLRQENIMIGGVEIPTIHCDGEVWYPANYINRHLFKRAKGNKLIDKEKEERLGDLYKIFDIDFGYDTGGIQPTKCVNKQGLEMIFKDFKIGRLNAEQKHNYNELVKNLDLNVNLVMEEGKDTISSNKELKQTIKSYNKFIQDCINEIIKEEPNIKWRVCNRCGNSYPIHKNFFKIDACKASNNEFMPFCKDCGLGNDNITMSDKNLNKVYRKYGEEYYVYYRNHNVIRLYEHCIRNSIELPQIIKNKEDYLIIIKSLYNKKRFTKGELTTKLLEDSFNLGSVNHIVKVDEIYSYLFGEDYWQYPWRYKNLYLPKLTYQQGKIILDNYINENSIKIENIFEFKYNELVHKARLSQLESDILSFVVYYHNYKYAGYKFKISSTNYWKVKENRIFDLKYFIEEDLKIPIDKIPLYLTKMTLQKHARSLYHLLYNGKYYKNLFEWVNECYPNKFIESDFVIGNHRDEFGSIEESQINDILHGYFSNVIYNQLNTDRTIKFSGKTPDWIILTDKGCIIVEYFGLYVVDREIHNSRINDYINRSNNKKEIYSNLDGYKFLYFYPEDLKDNFKGVKEKIENYIG